MTKRNRSFATELKHVAAGLEVQLMLKSEAYPLNTLVPSETHQHLTQTDSSCYTARPGTRSAVWRPAGYYRG